MTRAFLITVLAMACSRERAPAPAPPVPPAPAPSVAPGPVVLLTFAGFKEDKLIECDELFVRPTKPLSADAGAAAATLADNFWNAMSKKREKGLTVTRLTKLCGEQFAGRKPFGSCSDVGMSPQAKELRANVYHFSFASVFKSDWAMRECLELGGDWKAMSKDSPEYLEAKLSHDSDTVQKYYDDARKDVDRARRALQ